MWKPDATFRGWIGRATNAIHAAPGVRRKTDKTDAIGEGGSLQIIRVGTLFQSDYYIGLFI